MAEDLDLLINNYQKGKTVLSRFLKELYEDRERY
jgi:hypothetical protein